MKTCRGCIHRFETSECVECVVTGLDHKNFESLEDVKRKAMNEAYDKVIEYIRNQDCCGYFEDTKTEDIVNDILKLKGEN